MTDTLYFFVPGPPRGKGRPKFTRMGKGPRAYTPEKTATYENLVLLTALEARQGKGAMQGALCVEVLAHFPIPKSWSKKKRAAAKWHTSTPDGDNILKAVLDGLNGKLFADDAAVAHEHLIKTYVQDNIPPGLHVTIRQLD
jgi:Holliday junction resolvase RusA-like endonuclease